MREAWKLEKHPTLDVLDHDLEYREEFFTHTSAFNTKSPIGLCINLEIR